jgi:hypothetical protein
MKYELTIRGSAGELAEVLSFMNGRNTAGTDRRQVVPDSEFDRLDEYVSRLGGDGRAFLQAIANASVGDTRGVAETELMTILRGRRGADGKLVRMSLLYGVIGGLGRRWTSVFGDEYGTPFRARKVDGANYYRLEQQLAARVIELL